MSRAGPARGERAPSAEKSVTTAPFRWLGSALVFDVLGAIGLALGAYKTVQSSRSWLQWFDEGLLLSNTRVLTHGGWPYRNFYSQYPPGIFVILAGVWKVFGVGVLPGRNLSVIMRLGIATLSGLAGGRLCGRRFALLPAGLVMLWMALMGGPPYAWLGGLLFALAAALALASAAAGTGERWPERDAHAQLRPGPWILAGAMLGLTVSLRHDLCVYFCAATLPVAASWLYRRRLPGRDVLRIGGALAAGAAAPLAIFWLPTLVAVKWSLIYHDIYADQVKYVLPERALPFPPLLALTATKGLPFRLPAFLCQKDSAIACLIIAAPLLGLLAFVRARRRALGARATATAALVTVLAVAVIPQASGRAEWSHFLYAVTPGLLLAGALPYRTPGSASAWRGLVAGALLLVFCVRALREDYPPQGPLIPPIDPSSLDGSPMVGPIPDGRAEPRRQLRAFVVAQLAPEEPIFVGNQSHVTLYLNEADLYFTLEHPPVTRYLQFDPGIVTRQAVQEEIIRDLESKRPRMAILSDANQWGAGMKPGSAALDDYLAAHYALARDIGPYKVLFRK